MEAPVVLGALAGHADEVGKPGPVVAVAELTRGGLELGAHLGDALGGAALERAAHDRNALGDAAELGVVGGKWTLRATGHQRLLLRLVSARSGVMSGFVVGGPGGATGGGDGDGPGGATGEGEGETVGSVGAGG